MNIGQQVDDCGRPVHAPTSNPYDTSRQWSPPHYRVASVAEQMGVDPMSKLAAAINRLCDLIEGTPQ